MTAAGLLAQEASSPRLSGRQEALHALAPSLSPILRGEEVRVCLVGHRGSGKSAVLRELLSELHRAAAERGLHLPVYFVDGRPLGTAYRLLAVLVRLSGGGAPATGWSWGRMVEAWRAGVRGPAAVVVDHADEVAAAERLLRILAFDSPAPLGLVAAARNGSSLARGWGTTVPVATPEGPRRPPWIPLETGPGLGAATRQAAKGPEAGGGAEGGVLFRAMPLPPILPGNEGGAPQEEGGVPREEGEAAEGDATGNQEGPLPAFSGQARPSDGSGPGSLRPPPLTSELLRRVRLLDDAPRLLLALLAREEGLVTTGRLWSAYRRAAPDAGLRPLTLRRVSGLLRELEDAGLVSAPIVNRGRRGRTKWAALTYEARRALLEAGGPTPPPGTPAARPG